MSLDQSSSVMYSPFGPNLQSLVQGDSGGELKDDKTRTTPLKETVVNLSITSTPVSPPTSAVEAS